MRLRVSIYILLLFCNLVAAQTNAGLCPKWVKDTPGSTDPSIYFVVVHTDASPHLSAARASVKQDLASNVERTDKVEVSEVFEDNSRQNYKGDNVSMISQDSYSLKLRIEGTAEPIKSRRIDEYYKIVERGGMSVLDYYAVYAIEHKGMAADLSKISAVSSYGGLGLWRSAIVPGWGQMYKGSWLKGGLVLGGSVALAGGALTCGLIRNDNFAKMANTHSSSVKQQYAARANMLNTGMYCCIGGLAALYVYNLIDAAVAPGARRIIVYPTVADNGSIGLGGSIRF